MIGVPFGLDSVTAVVIGGTVLTGGRGDVLVVWLVPLFLTFSVSLRFISMC